MDGENTTIHVSGSHARSPDSRYHPSRDWLKAFAAGISPHLTADERIIGENLYARHPVAYDALPSFFLGFAWIVGDQVQSWDLTQARFEELGIQSVPTLYRGSYRAGLFEDLAQALDLTRQEGFVARVADAFAEGDMPRRVGKYVRAGYIQSEIHWMKAQLIPNCLQDTSRPLRPAKRTVKHVLSSHNWGDWQFLVSARGSLSSTRSTPMSPQDGGSKIWNCHLHAGSQKAPRLQRSHPALVLTGQLVGTVRGRRGVGKRAPPSGRVVVDTMIEDLRGDPEPEEALKLAAA